MAEKIGGKTLLNPTTAEFTQLEYALQLASKSSTIKIINAFVLSNAHLTNQFEKKSKDKLILSSWVDSSELNGSNTEEEVIRRGFQLGHSNGGLVFGVGSILQQRTQDVGSSDKEASQTNMGPSKNKHKALLCLVGVGRSYVVEDRMMASKESIPEGYDSLYIQDAVISKPDNAEYYHEYYVNSDAQVLPQYLVHFEYDLLKEKENREKPKCDNCEVEYAKVYCAADCANFCEKCDAETHNTKFMSRHVRTPIGKGPDVFGVCRNHPEKSIEYFCSECHFPVCVSCKMVGNHANGEFSRHQLVSVAEAYQSVLQESQVFDPIFQSRRTEISNQLACINARAKAVEKMANSIKEQIEDCYRKSIIDLRSKVNEKINVLLSDELELKRQYEEIDRFENFLQYQRDGEATQFLFSWVRHQELRQELHDFKYFRETIDVKLDLKVHGNLTVIVDDTAQTLMSSPTKRTIVNSSKPPVPPTVSPFSDLKNGNLGRMGPRAPSIMADKFGNEMRIQRRTSDFFAETWFIC